MTPTPSNPDSRIQPTTEHTPTPWRVFTNPDGTKLVGIGASIGTCVGNLHPKLRQGPSRGPFGWQGTFQ
jgi:hypothetical protein